jgi:hypothetical protein
VRTEALRRLIVAGPLIKPGQAFVPCSVCKSPIDLAATPLDERICASCALTLMGHSSN